MTKVTNISCSIISQQYTLCVISCIVNLYYYYYWYFLHHLHLLSLVTT